MIATTLWAAFHRCTETATEIDAGNDLLVLLHGKLHRRLGDLRTPFLRKAQAGGVSYAEAARPFDAVDKALGVMMQIAQVHLYLPNGEARIDEATKKTIASVEAEYFRSAVDLGQLVEFVIAPDAAGRPSAAPDQGPARSSPASGTSPQTGADGAEDLTAVERALVIYSRDPSQTVAEVARRAGCDRSLLYKDERFKRLRQAHQGTMPKGSKSKTGDMEAEDDCER